MDGSQHYSVVAGEIFGLPTRHVNNKQHHRVALLLNFTNKRFRKLSLFERSISGLNGVLGFRLSSKGTALTTPYGFKGEQVDLESTDSPQQNRRYNLMSMALLIPPITASSRIILALEVLRSEPTNIILLITTLSSSNIEKR